MKGIVFTEFLELVEKGFGFDMADKIQTEGCPSQTAFTSVGSYDHRDLLAMVGVLSQESNMAAPELVTLFGKHLFQRFRDMYPHAFEGIHRTFDLLERVEDAIHVEVLKLTPNAELPSFHFHPATPGEMRMEYLSQRPFADLAHGLIAASIEHFGEDLIVRRENLEGPPGTHALFHLIPTPTT